jgi:hypothetical protein
MRLIHMVAGAAILIGAAFATNLIWKSGPSNAAGDLKAMRTITVSGEGQVFAAPDQAQINAGVVTDGPTAKEALARNSTRMAEVIAALKKMGVESKDIQTSGFNLSPMYLPQPSGQTVPRIGSYQVSNNVTVVIKDLAKLGEIMDQVVQMGSNSVGGVSFSIAEPKPLMMKAREAAVADAKLRADAYAKAAGVSVGKVVTISEVAGPVVQPMPVYAMRAAAADGAAVPVESGQQQLSLNVTVVYEID